uniref:diaminopimelate epimerase n=1 Tax=Wolbachia endosymbiont of Pentidionis agamae TaxID=3110435 RepID=UPI002FD033C4
KINMGKPLFQWNEIPLSSEYNTLCLPIEIAMLKNPVAVNIGNPHLIFFVKNIINVPFEKLAPTLENHELFPNKINVSVAEISKKKHIILKTWERGVGITDSCGSAACAALVASILRKYISHKETRVKLIGGDLLIEWDETTNNVFMTGKVEYVFHGFMNI